jgi:hypothetical protein
VLCHKELDAFKKDHLVFSRARLQQDEKAGRNDRNRQNDHEHKLTLGELG